MIHYEDKEPLRLEVQVVDTASPALERAGKKLAQAKKAMARVNTKRKGKHTMAQKTAAAEKPKRAVFGALSKPVTPGPALVPITGSAPLPRTDVVKKLWEHIKAKNLQNPANKREIMADDVLRPIFGKDKVTMFEMNGLISKHLTA